MSCTLSNSRPKKLKKGTSNLGKGGTEHLDTLYSNTILVIGVIHSVQTGEESRVQKRQEGGPRKLQAN